MIKCQILIIGKNERQEGMEQQNIKVFKPPIFSFPEGIPA